jgi:cardiolipin-specific phospholipase
MFRRMAGMWEWNFSPFNFLRRTGYYGANKMLNGYVRRRLNLDSEAEKEAFKEILLQTSMRNISSEVCITMILEFGAWARAPMQDRIKDI